LPVEVLTAEVTSGSRPEYLVQVARLRPEAVNTRLLSHFVEDGSFIRLRDISISYDLTSLVHTKWLRSLVFTASGRNLATWTKYSGLDPEVTSAVSTSTGGGLGSIGSNAGVDFYGQPNLKSYQFGFNIGF